jgi:hypothetical protein
MVAATSGEAGEIEGVGAAVCIFYSLVRWFRSAFRALNEICRPARSEQGIAEFRYFEESSGKQNARKRDDE